MDQIPGPISSPIATFPIGEDGQCIAQPTQPLQCERIEHHRVDTQGLDNRGGSVGIPQAVGFLAPAPGLRKSMSRRASGGIFDCCLRWCALSPAMCQ